MLEKFNDLVIGRDAEGEEVVIRGSMRPNHIFTAGATNSGKSNTAKSFFAQDIMRGTPSIVFNPFGDFGRQAYSMADGDCVYCSLEHPVGLEIFNLEYSPYDNASSWKACMNHYVTGTSSNMELTTRMTNIQYQQLVKCLEQGKDDLISLRDSIDLLTGNVEARAGLVDRLTYPILDERVAHILCHAEKVRWRDIFQQRKTFIMDCTGMSNETVTFFSALISHCIIMYMRYDKANEKPPVSFVVDECHMALNPDFLDILKQARHLGISAHLMTQDFANMDPKYTMTLLSNVGTILCYRVGSFEASLLSKEFRNVTPSQLQFPEEQYMCAYRTPDGEGFVKANRCPYFREIPITQTAKEIDIDLMPRWEPMVEIERAQGMSA